MTNSLGQLERLADAHAERAKSLALLPEYRFFRHRYPRSDADETALLVVTDATIRRWCRPKWRITTSSRTRAAAILAELQARELDTLVRGDVRLRELKTKMHVPELGRVILTDTGVASSADRRTRLHDGHAGLSKFVQPLASRLPAKLQPVFRCNCRAVLGPRRAAVRQPLRHAADRRQLLPRSSKTPATRTPGRCCTGH